MTDVWMASVVHSTYQVNSVPSSACSTGWLSASMAEETGSDMLKL